MLIFQAGSPEKSLSKISDSPDSYAIIVFYYWPRITLMDVNITSTRSIEDELKATAELKEQGIDVLFIANMSEEERLEYIQNIKLDKGQTDLLLMLLQERLPAESLANISLLANQLIDKNIHGQRTASLSDRLESIRKNKEKMANASSAQQDLNDNPKSKSINTALKTDFQANPKTLELINRAQNISANLKEENPADEPKISEEPKPEDAAKTDSTLTNKAKELGNGINQQASQMAPPMIAGRRNFTMPRFRFSNKKDTSNIDPQPSKQTNHHEAPIATPKVVYTLDSGANVFHQADVLRKKGVNPEQCSPEQEVIFNREKALIKQEQARDVRQADLGLQDSESMVKSAFDSYNSLFSKKIQKQLTEMPSEEDRRALIESEIAAGRIKQSALDEKKAEILKVVSNYESKIIETATELTKKGHQEEAIGLPDRFKEKINKNASESYFNDSQPKNIGESLEKLCQDVAKAIASIISRLFSRKNSTETREVSSFSM